MPHLFLFTPNGGIKIGSLGILELRELLGKTAETMSDDEVLKTESLVRRFAKIVADRIWLMTPKEMKTMDDKI